MWIDGISKQLGLGLTWPERCQIRPHRGQLQVWKGPGHDFVPEAGGVDPGQWKTNQDRTKCLNL